MEIINGNLLKFPRGIEAICHGCNTFNCFGAGLAAQIKKEIPSAFVADTTSKKAKSNNLGEISYCRTVYKKNTKWVFNLYQQNNTGTGVNLKYEAFKSAMIKMRKVCEQLDLSIGIPHGIGCGLAGGDWRVVRLIIEEVWKDYKKPIYIIKYENIEK